MYAKERKKKKMKTIKKKYAMLCYTICVFVCLSVYKITGNASSSANGLELTLNLHRHHHHHHHHHHQHPYRHIAARST